MAARMSGGRIRLSSSERRQLQKWAADRARPGRARRCGIVLLCAEGRSDAEVARTVSVSRSAVGYWRRLVARRGIRFLESPASGYGVGAGAVADRDRAVVRALKKSEPGVDRYERVARRFGLSLSSIYRIARAQGLTRRSASPGGGLVADVAGYLRECISRESPGSRLPAVREIAARLGVSGSVVQSAVRQMRREGLVRTIRGKGTYVAADEQSNTFPESNNPGTTDGADRLPWRPPLKWERVAKRILADILSGVYGPGNPLPSCKELTREYGAGFRTITRALNSIREEVDFESFREPPAPVFDSGRHRAAIVVLIPLNVDSGLRSMNAHFREVLPLFESVCAERNIAIAPVSLFRKFRQPRALRELGLGELVKRRTVLGFCVWAADCSAVKGLAEHLAGFHLPVAVLDNAGVAEIRRTVERFERFTVFLHGSGPMAPRNVARHLISLGHRHGAYFSLNHDMEWSVRRLAVLESVFRSVSPESTITPFIAEAFSERTEILAAFEGPVSFQRARLSYLPKDCRGPGARFLDLLQARIDETTQPIQRFFEEALRDRRITVWIAANDRLGTMALSYLGSKNVAVPGRISVVGFDNSPDAFVNNLTSYDFRIRATIEQMVGFIVDTPLFRRVHGSQRVVEVAGSLVGHGSLGTG